MKLSVVIPARNEEGSIGANLAAITRRLAAEEIDFEVLVVDDASTDRTAEVVTEVMAKDPRVRYLLSPNDRGFGLTVRAGLDVFTGDGVAITMADGSDDPDDLVAYYRLLEAGYDCAFGSRFMSGGGVSGYPIIKLIMNRIVNAGIRLMFGHGYNDTTNAFKAYRREVIETVQPLLSNHFNLTIEIPLKAVVRGHSYAIIPIRWTNRTADDSKLKFNEMGSRYLFILLYVFFEHHLSRGDYRRLDRGNRSRWRVSSPSMRARLPADDGREPARK